MTMRQTGSMVRTSERKAMDKAAKSMLAGAKAELREVHGIRDPDEWLRKNDEAAMAAKEGRCVSA